MSTSSCSTVNRCASSFARSSTSPTSRSSRAVSSAITSSDAPRASSSVDEPLAERGDVAADRGQRRAQLVRDRHQEVPLELLGLGELRRHLAEAVGEVADLAAAGHRRDLDVVVALGDLVGGVGEREHRLRDPPRQVPGEPADEHDRDRERHRQPPEQRDEPVVQLRLRRRDDERAEHVRRRSGAARRPRCTAVLSPGGVNSNWTIRCRGERRPVDVRRAAAAGTCSGSPGNG